MIDRKGIAVLAQRVVRKMENLGNDTNLKEDCPISIIDIYQWEWAQGVGLYGLLKRYQSTKDAEILRFLEGWFDRNLQKGLPPKNVNTMCPLLTLSFVYEHTKKPEYLAICQEWAEWIMKEMPRTEEGGLQHCVSGNLNDGQLWDDTLFMTVLFLTRMGILLNRQDYLDESVHQFLVHSKYLIDPPSGLLFHGWTFHGRHHFAKARWARGNCWYTAGLPEYLEFYPGLPQGVRRYLLATFESQVKALAALQDGSGKWHTLLDDKASYTETSATAGFAYGILKGIRLGYLPASYAPMAERAADSVVVSINPEGTVTGVSYGTGMGSDLDFYRNIPLCPMTYGQALTLMLLDEYGKLVK